MPQGTVSVLGCGWLGLPLAVSLVRAGYTVRGSTTSESGRDRLARAGIEPCRIVVGEDIEGETEGFFASDFLIFTIPPSSGPAEYPAVAATVRRAAEAGSVGWVLMTSSTSVYPNLDRTVTESDAGGGEGQSLPRRGTAVLAAEQVFRASTGFDTTVLRLAGLYGYDRHPARSLAGRSDLSGGEAPTNLVHRDDVIRAVEAILNHNARGATFNICADVHPTRRRLYTTVATRLGLEPPTFADDSGDRFKVVSNTRLKERLDFAFRYPDPIEPAP